jgi:hypothetical protein
MGAREVAHLLLLGAGETPPDSNLPQERGVVKFEKKGAIASFCIINSFNY